jgi:hypothetical protein
MTILDSADNAREFEEIRPGHCVRPVSWSVASTSARDQDIAQLAMWKDGEKVQQMLLDSLINAQPPA